MQWITVLLVSKNGIRGCTELVFENIAAQTSETFTTVKVVFYLNKYIFPLFMGGSPECVCEDTL